MVRVNARRRKKSVSVREPEHRKEPVTVGEPARDDAQQVDTRPVLAHPISFRECFYWDHPRATERARLELEKAYEDAPANATGDMVALYDKRIERRRRERRDNRKRRVIDTLARTLAKTKGDVW
jgi:hypothetical protein